MKKIVLVLMALALVAGSVFAAPSKKVTLKVWESQGPEEKFIKQAIKDYRKVDRNVKFIYEPVGSVDADGKIMLDGPAGVGADVFVVPHDHMGSLVIGGHILENTMDMSAFVPAAVIGASYGGKVYGYPLAVETYALFYNKDIIPNPPKTWEEVFEFAKTWTDKSKNKYAIAWPVTDAYYDFLFYAGYGAQLFGPNGDDRHQHNLNSPEAVKGVQFFQQVRKQILDVPSGDMTGDFVKSSFQEGTIPMVLGGPWDIAVYKEAGVNFGITTLPILPGAKDVPASFSGVRLAVVSAYSENPEQAKKFAEFLVSREELVKRFDITGQIPPRKDITVEDEWSQGILAQSQYAIPMPKITQIGTYWSAMGAAFANVWDGADPVDELNKAAAAMEAAR
ncbi:MAG: extracellular solute-binding protein [Spirochaetes bacterium]|uniref:Maltodextrin-binding protein n=1 Tax=Candidatus Gallitreponema excrementavium TaxID=2840840 RepID=A0A9D9HMW7_9SPIR|nr:extracellular solute-binding protein [Candidatus Gallitreponema excrementavium]